MSKFAGLVLVLFLCSCTHFRFERDDSAEPASVHEYKLEHYVWGGFTGAELPSPPCPNGSLKNVHFQMSFMDVLLTTVTAGLYVPHRATLTCSKI